MSQQNEAPPIPDLNEILKAAREMAPGLMAKAGKPKRSNRALLVKALTPLFKLLSALFLSPWVVMLILGFLGHTLPLPYLFHFGYWVTMLCMFGAGTTYEAITKIGFDK